MKHAKTLVFIGICLITGLYAFNVDFFNKPQEKRFVIIVENLESNNSSQLTHYAVEAFKSIDTTIVVEIADLKKYNLPFIDVAIPPAAAPIESFEVVQWNEQIKQADGFVAIVQNYNEGYSGSLKNAMDLLWQSWHNKPFAVIGYSDCASTGQDFITSVLQTLHGFKTEPLLPLYISQLSSKLKDHDEGVEIKSQIKDAVNNFYAASLQKNSSMRLFRTTTDLVKRFLLKMKYKYLYKSS